MLPAVFTTVLRIVFPSRFIRAKAGGDCARRIPLFILAVCAASAVLSGCGYDASKATPHEVIVTDENNRIVRDMSFTGEPLEEDSRLLTKAGDLGVGSGKAYRTSDGRIFYVGDGGLAVTHFGLFGKKPVDTKVYKGRAEDLYEGETGTAGRLYVPECGVSVKMTLINDDNVDDVQAVTDNPGEAAYIMYQGQGTPVIADHSMQGFESIKSAVPGETKAYILSGGELSVYVCSLIEQGTNSLDDLITESGQSIWTANRGGINLYTCNEDWEHVTCMFFEKLKE